ncbi:MAG TPA: ABC transporter permease [Vicinamibacterales bacterium]|nr:ABC transporter permease [Vicinamibacterales bacterium]
MNVLRDIRFGARLLLRNRTYAAAALTVISLGIGATTAVLSVVNGVLLQRLPYEAPDRLVLFRADLPGFVRQPALTAVELAALCGQTDVFESVAVINESEASLTAPDDMTALTAASVSDNFFSTLGVGPLLGRIVGRSDLGAGWVSGVDISYDLWQRRFHGRPDIVGLPIEINNLPMQVVGVLPKDFRAYLGSSVPIDPSTSVFFPRGRGYDDDPFRGQIVLARLRAEVTPASAQRVVDSSVRALVAARPSDYPTGKVRITAARLDRDVVRDVRPALLALTGAVGFVLLVACANLTNLLLARTTARRREIAVRASIGASRARLIRQLAAEGAVTGVAGAVGGVFIAQWLVAAMLALAPSTLPRREAIVVDVRVAALAVALAVVCTIAVSLLPAWQLTRSAVFTHLREAPLPPKRATVTRGAFVASQLALSLVLLVGAGLMMRAFAALRAVPLGFDPSHVLTMNVHLDGRRFDAGSIEDSRVVRREFYERLTDAVRRIPGVEQAGLVLPTPLASVPNTHRYAAGPGEPQRAADLLIAFEGTLEALRVPLVAGRYFTRADHARAVVIVDRRVAETLWPGQSAIGRRLQIDLNLGPKWTEVVGVVEHVRTRNLRADGPPQIWETYATQAYAGLTLVVRTSRPIALAPAVERTVRSLGPGRPVEAVAPLADYVAAASSDTRFALFVLGGFAILAVVLAAVGVYGVVAYTTARRTREIAVRLALGADATAIVRLIASEASLWIASGIASGAIGALWLSRYLETLLFSVTPHDRLTFVAVIGLLAGVAAAASAIPAFRAVRADPMLALRSE